MSRRPPVSDGYRYDAATAARLLSAIRGDIELALMRSPDDVAAASRSVLEREAAAHGVEPVEAARALGRALQGSDPDGATARWLVSLVAREPNG